MEHRTIGSLTVSAIGLGCNNFGMRVDEARTREVIDAALDSGINFFDTADIYGGTKSEEFMGRVLNGRRDKAIIATKFGMEAAPGKKGARPEYVRQACEDSLRRLDIETIDLYQLHAPDEETPIAETLGALHELVEQGKVREIGCSNFSAEQLREAEREARGAKFVSVQNEFSLIVRDPIAEVLPECRRQAMAFLPYFPLASGLLTGKYRQGQPRPEGTRLSQGERADRILSEANLALVSRLTSFAESKGRSMLELAFGWLLSQPQVASVIAGATSAAQVRSNAEAGGWRLTAQELAEVESMLSPVSAG